MFSGSTLVPPEFSEGARFRLGSLRIKTEYGLHNSKGSLLVRTIVKDEKGRGNENDSPFK